MHEWMLITKMKKKNVGGLALILLAVCCTASADQVFIYEVSISKNDSVNLKDFSLIEGKVNTAQTPAGEYTIKILSATKELFTAEIKVSFQTHEDAIDKDGKMHQIPVDLAKVNKFLRLPYSKDATKINLYHKDTVIYSLDIPEKLCVRDGKCSDYCQDKNDPDCAKPAKLDTYETLPYLLAALIAIIAAFVFLRKKLQR